eukprot:1174121-Prorocentrum_minimum.AAC.1
MRRVQELAVGWRGAWGRGARRVGAWGRSGSRGLALCCSGGRAKFSREHGRGGSFTQGTICRR